MKLAAVAMVRNEADIVEAFVRHNLAYVDRLVVVDHHSDDGTFEILRELEREGLAIEIEPEPALAFDQARRLTMSARRLARAERPDWIFCLDADEFLRAPARAALEHALARATSEAVSIPWRTYLPSERVHDARHALAQARERPRTEPVPLSKVVLSGRLAESEGWVLAHGNHGASRPRDGAHDLVVAPQLADVALAHFPIRSPDQLVRKVTLGWFGHKLLLGRVADTTPMGWHWRELYKRFAAGHWPTRAELRALCVGAYVYQGDSAAGRAHPLELVVDPLPLHPLRYTSEQSQSALVAIVRWTDALLTEQAKKGDAHH